MSCYSLPVNGFGIIQYQLIKLHQWHWT